MEEVTSEGSEGLWVTQAHRLMRECPTMSPRWNQLLCGVVLVSAVSSREQTAVQNYQSPPSDKKSVAFNFQERKNRRNIVPRSPNHSTDETH